MTVVRSHNLAVALSVVVAAGALVAGLASSLDDHWLGYAATAAAGTLVALVLSRWPGPVVIALAVYLPVQQTALGLAFKAGVPAAGVRALNGLPEVLAAGLVLAALVAVVAERRRPAAVDAAALAYLTVVGLYLVLPHLFTPGAPLGLRPRLEALRSDCGFVIVFLAVRHAPLTARARRGLRSAVMIVGSVVVAGALVEKLSPAGWKAFMLNDADARVLLLRVFGESVAQVSDGLRYVNNIQPVRVGSIFYSPFDMADYLLIVAAVCIERILRADRSPAPLILLAGALAALWLSEVRADALALSAVALWAVTRPYHPRPARLRLLALFAVAAVVAVPVLSGSRFTGGGGASVSSVVHVNEVDHGVDVFVHHPLGLGLGEQSAATAYLPGSSGGETSLTSDNAETQVADELGVLGLVTWLAFVVAALAGLWRARSAPGRFWSGAALLALAGTIVAGQFHQVFVEFDVPWLLWALVGVGLPALSPAARPVLAAAA